MKDYDKTSSIEMIFMILNQSVPLPLSFNQDAELALALFVRANKDDISNYIY